MLQLFLLSSLVLAQETQAETPIDSPGEVLSETIAVSSETPVATPEVVEAAPAVTEGVLHRLEAAAFYKVALELVGEGQYEEARILFEQLVATYGDTDIAPRAQTQWDNLGMLSNGNIADTAVLAAAYEEEGWAELAVNQGIAMPVIMGFLIPAGTTQPDEPGIPVAMGMLGLGVGVGGAYYLDKHYSLDRGHAMAVFSGEWIGLLNGVMASAITEPRDYRGHFRYMLGGTLLGGGIGAVSGHYLDFDSGDMALLNTGAIWGGVLGLTSFIFVDSETEKGSYIRSIGAIDLGILAAALIGTRWDPSRKRMAIINMSAVAGAGLGVGFGFFGAFYGDMDEEGYTVVVTASAAVGALVGGYLSRNRDGEALSSVLNLNNGKLALGTPIPTPMVGPAGHKAFGFSLANGRF
jgi:hypothetical protein